MLAAKSARSMDKRELARDFNSASDNETLCHAVLIIRGPQRTCCWVQWGGIRDPQRAPLLRVMGWNSLSARFSGRTALAVLQVFGGDDISSLLVRFGVPKAELSGCSPGPKSSLPQPRER